MASRAVVKRAVHSPDGASWRVGRRWVGRWEWHSSMLRRRASDGAGWGWLDGLPLDLDVQNGLILAVIGILVVLVLIPVLVFGIELVVAGTVIAAGLIGRLFLGRAWVIEARTSSGLGDADRMLEWKVSGWRRSRRVIDEIAADIGAGRAPDPPSARAGV